MLSVSEFLVSSHRILNFHNSTCFRYKVSFVGADDTHSLEFMFFEKKGAELIGKSAETLRKQYEPSTIPPEISQWIGHKFTFIVKVLSKKSAQSIDPSFEVLLIKERHGKQATLPTIRYKTSISCNTDTTEHNDLPPLITIPSKRKSTEV